MTLTRSTLTLAPRNTHLDLVEPDVGEEHDHSVAVVLLQLWEKCVCVNGVCVHHEQKHKFQR